MQENIYIQYSKMALWTIRRVVEQLNSIAHPTNEGYLVRCTRTLRAAPRTLLLQGFTMSKFGLNRQPYMVINTAG